MATIRIKQNQKVAKAVKHFSDKSNPQNHKSSYKNILDSAQKEDPELGLGFDPIFDAADASAGYVTVLGNDWK